MRKPKGLSYYKRIALGEYFSINPSTNGLSMSIGVPGARIIIPIITLRERPPMLHLQKQGFRYRKQITNIEILLAEALDVAEHDVATAAKLYRRAKHYAIENYMPEIHLGKGYTGRKSYDPPKTLISPEDYLKLGASIRGEYEKFRKIVEEIRKK